MSWLPVLAVLAAAVLSAVITTWVLGRSRRHEMSARRAAESRHPSGRAPQQPRRWRRAPQPAHLTYIPRPRPEINPKDAQ